MTTATQEQPLEQAIIDAPQSRELARVIGDSSLTAETAREIVETFGPIYIEARRIIDDSQSIAVTDATQVTEMKQARQARLTLRDVRLRGDKQHKKLKEDALRVGQTLDLVKRTLVGIIEPEEKRLEECEKFAERAEAARKAELKAEREALLAEFDVDCSCYQLGEMTAPQFEQLVESSRIARDQRLERERKEEEERKAKAEADRIESERIKAENARLKLEADTRDLITKASTVDTLLRIRQREDFPSALTEQANARHDEIVSQRRQTSFNALNDAINEATDDEDFTNAIEAIERAYHSPIVVSDGNEAPMLPADKYGLLKDKLNDRRREVEQNRRLAAQAEEDRRARERLENKNRADEIAAKRAADAAAEAQRRAEQAPDAEKIQAVAHAVGALSSGLPTMATDKGRAALMRVDDLLRECARAIEVEAGLLRAG